MKSIPAQVDEDEEEEGNILSKFFVKETKYGMSRCCLSHILLYNIFVFLQIFSMLACAGSISTS
jgi:hypothetical protein